MLSGRYRVERALGTGGQGEVVAAVDTWYADRPVALKRVPPDAAAYLQREFAALKTLEHPGIVAALDFGRHGGDAFLVEERIDGEQLADWVSRRDPAAVCRLLAPVAHALAHLHARGFVHLDVSPRNIMVEGGPAPRAVLIDLGLARPIGEVGASGTPGFVAPELLFGEPGTPAADVYSLGATIAAALGDGELRGSGAPDLTDLEPTAVRNLVAECLSEAPGSRPSALRLARTLAGVAGVDPELDRPLTSLPLCGREDALEAFGAWLALGRGPFVVRAETGLGTTAFLGAAADRARAEGILVLDVVGGEPGAAERLLARVVASAADDALLLADLGAELADVVDDPRLPPAAGAARSSEELAQLVVLAVDALHADRPTLVVVDEASEATGPLAEALRIWRRRRTDSGARVAIGTGFSGSRDEDGVTLEPLGAGAIDRILSLAYAEQRPRAEAEHLLSLCGGVPAALRRALEAIASRRCGVLDLDAAALGDDDIPELPAALCPLAGSTSAVTAAVIEVLVPDTDQRQTTLRAALRAGVLTVEARATGLRFCVPARVRRQLHLDAAAYRRLAEAIDAAGDRLAAAGPWAMAGDEKRACNALAAGAGAPASARLAAFEVVAGALGSSGLDDPLLAAWAELAAGAGRVDAARRAAKELAARGAGAVADRHLAAALVRAGQYAEALSALGEETRDAASAAARARALLFSGRAQEAREVAAASWQTAAGAARAELLDVLGHAAFQSGDVEAATEALRRALDEAQAGGDAGTIGRAYHGLAIVLQRCGERQEALRAYRASLEAADSLSRLVRTRNLATLLQDLGELVEAQTSYRAALSHAVALANVREQAHVGVNLANLEVLLGELAVATALAERTMDLCERHDLGHAAAMAALVLCEASIERRDVDAAGLALARAKDQLEGIEDPTAIAELALLSARLAAAKRDGVAALASLEAVDPRGAAEHIPRQLAFWRARLRLEIGGAPDQAAVETAERAVAAARASDDAELTWRALAVLARMRDEAEVGGDAARDEARQALEIFLAPMPDEVRTSYLSCQSRRELAAWLRPSRREDVSVAVHGVGLAAYRRLLAINRRLAREQAVDALLELIVDTAIELLGAERGFLILREGESVRIAVARNFDRRSLEDGRQRISRSIASEVLRVGEAVLTTNAQEDQRYAGIASVATLKVRSVMCIPLRGTARDDDPIIGALYLDHRFQDRAFTEEDVSLCGAFADQAAIALENARLLEQTREQERRLQVQNERLERLNAQLRKEAAAFAAEAEAALRRLREEGPLVGVGRGFERIVGRSDRLREALRLVDRFADTDVPVVISGESGTGKELIARAIHERSARSSRAFVSINCGAIPENLIESELFGYEKGAFTGAVRNKAGLFAAAEGGTLLLDEIGEMPLTMQVKLLRVIQEKELRPVGATRSVRADVRILSASHRDLEGLVSQGAFREDLLYRLRVVEVAVPPLRERREDIPLLVDHFCREITGRPADACFSKEALARLMGHDWPGNVRELDNEVRRALALADDVVGLEDLSERLQAARAAGAAILAGESRGSLKEIIDGFEREVLLATLDRTSWNVRQTAKDLGLSRAALYTRLNRFGITREAKK
jgi:transcriptional regulator with GAF, ATPase, and Fis domain